MRGKIEYTLVYLLTGRGSRETETFYSKSKAIDFANELIDSGKARDAKISSFEHGVVFSRACNDS